MWALSSFHLVMMRYFAMFYEYLINYNHISMSSFPHAFNLSDTFIGFNFKKLLTYLSDDYDNDAAWSRLGSEIVKRARKSILKSHFRFEWCFSIGCHVYWGCLAQDKIRVIVLRLRQMAMRKRSNWVMLNCERGECWYGGGA